MSKQRQSGGSGGTAPESRADRLARELRENLRRRKAQARARAATAEPAGAKDEDGTGTPADDG